MGILCKSIPGFLGDAERERLYEYVLANESRFVPTTVTDGMNSCFDERVRKSLHLLDLGEMQTLIEQKVYELVPSLVKEFGLANFTPSGLETEVVAHGDGAFYSRHIDVFTGTGRVSQEVDRMLTLVYYFYREPKSFTGGSLRLYPLPSIAERAQVEPIDIQVAQDTVVAFPTWLPHEVMKVDCPSGEFSDSRFTVNCWVLKERSHPGK